MSANQYLEWIATGGRLREKGVRGLFDLFGARLKAYFRRLGCSDEDAADLLQETFIRVVRGAEQYRGESQVSTWIWTIARNCLHDRWRGRDEALSLDALTDEAGDAFDSVAGTVLPDHEMRELQDCVRAAFVAFGEAYPDSAQAVRLATVEGWSMDELGGFLGRTANATKEYVSQCRKRLRPFLERCRELLPA